MKILFSPVGMTDPVSDEKSRETKEVIAVHDGALLQICRNERPDLVYLFFSQDTYNLEKQDHRYLGGLELLSQEIGVQFQIEVIERPELVNVHLFDAFLQEFREILTGICSEYPDAEILVNVSSGTPAMKSTLQILAAASELNLIPLQVPTWKEAPNHPRDCNIQAEWQLNVDNQPDAPNRVKKSENRNLLFEFNRKVLEQLIDGYDYRAAQVLCRQMAGLIPRRFTDLLDAAALRNDAKFTAARQKFRECRKEDLMPDAPNVSEYFLLLDIYVKKQKYTDFLRAMTPFMIDLFASALRRKCGILLADYTRRNDPTQWDDRAVAQSDLYGKFNQLPQYHQNDRRTHQNAPAVMKGFVLSWHLTNLIENLANPQTDWRFVEETIKLRAIEEEARNRAAHTMHGFSEIEFNRIVHCSPRALVEKMRDYIRSYTDIPLDDALLSSYQIMNEKLKSYLYP